MCASCMLIGRHCDQQEEFCGKTLRKARSLENLNAELVIVSPKKTRALNSRRRISSFEDLLSLAGREEQHAAPPPPAMTSLAESTEEGTAPLAPLPSHKQQPCDEPDCDGTCGPALSITTTAAAEEIIGIIEAPPAPPAEPALAPEQRVAALAAPSPQAEASPPAGLSPRVPKPSALLSSIRSVVPSALFTGEDAPPLSAHSPVLPDRRGSCDLGHVAPSSSHHLGQGHAAVELFYRLNHARQTVDYVKRQAASYATLNRAEMDVWEALSLLGSLREYESALVGGDACDADMPLAEHALQTAEACRVAFPEHDWMALVGLIHGLGKLLAHQQFGAEPQWAVCGESFPVGCRFHPSVVHSQYFQANPDRRRRAYTSSTGVYQPGCGLSSVLMSWSGAEYLYMVLAKNPTLLPPQALFLIRFQKFSAVLRPGGPYSELLSPADRAMLPMLAKFREIAEYRRADVPGTLEGEELRSFYDGLLAKYIPRGKLRW